MLQLKNITKNYAAGDNVVRALRGIDLQFRPHEFVSILGPSGCGKTTMLNIIGGLAVNFGHDFPALLGFRGGKGVLCGITVAFVADWRCALVVLAVFIICLWLTRYVSLSSILGSLTFVVSFSIVHRQNIPLVVMGSALGLFIVFMHRSNISRLLKGNERKATFSKFRKKK